MRESLHTLLVDDNPDDRTLVIRELRRQFPNLRAQEVADAASFASALSASAYDLVITDYQLRWTDGLHVLRTVKSKWPDCPVVMFTGTGSEEIAVEAMKAGLDDYVLKSPRHYGRLPAAAKLALKVAQQKQQLKDAEARYSLLFTSVPVGLYRAGADGKILDANPALVQMLQYPDRATLLSTHFAELYLESGAYRDWQALMDQTGVVHRHQAQFRTFGGQPCWAENSARAIREPRSGRVIYEGTVENVTERKEAEEERERLIAELQEALAKIKTLGGLLPICASCKRIRDDNGYWNQIEQFIQSHSDAEFTHSFCPDCVKNLYPDLFQDRANAAR